MSGSTAMQLAGIFSFSSERSIHVIDKDNAGVNDVWICIGRTERCEKKGFVMGGETGS